MTDYGASIQLTDKMTPILNNIIEALNMTVSSVYDMQSAVEGFDASSLNAVRDTIAQAEAAFDSFREKANEPISPNAPHETPQPQTVTWSSGNFDVFTNTGTDRFTSEAQSALNMMNQLTAKQQQIAANAQKTDVFSDTAVSDMTTIGTRMTAIQSRIQQIESNPANPLDPSASNELEHLRQQMSQALSIQEQINDAVNDMDVSRANSLYHQLNNVINQTEQEIRDNVDEQGRFTNAVNQSVVSSGNLKGAFSRIASGIGLYKIGSALMSTSREAVSFASDLNEVQNVVDVTFSSAAESVNEWASNTLDQFGINELSAKRYAGTMGAMLKSSGVSADAISDMSMSIAELSGDMASFYNLESDEAFSKLRSGISGETEPLKQLGINMSVANLEAYALSQGITKAYSDMSQGEQVMLRYNYLIQQTADAQGDFARTQDSYANQTKLLAENWNALAGTIASYVIPKLTEIVQEVNNMIAKMQPYSQQIASAFGVIITVAGRLIGILANASGYIAENWSSISPILFGVATAIGVVCAALLVYNTYSAIHNGIEKIKAAQEALSAGATLAKAAALKTATGAQVGMNAALLASPVTKIIIVIAALIALISIVIGVIKRATGTTTSAIGMIFGAVCWVGALILNTVIGLVNAVIQFLWVRFVEPFIGIIEWVLNVCNGGFDSFGGAVANLVGNIISWFLFLGQVVTKIIDAIFGTNWTAGLESLKNTVTSWGKTDTAITLSREAPQISYRMDMTDAYSWGASKGDAFSEKMSGMFSLDTLTDTENEAMTKALSENTAENTALTAENTGDLKDAVGASADDTMEWLRKITERDAVNKFTTAEIKLEFKSNATLNSDMDIDGLINRINDELQETLVSTAEGLER